MPELCRPRRKLPSSSAGWKSMKYEIPKTLLHPESANREDGTKGDLRKTVCLAEVLALLQLRFARNGGIKMAGKETARPEKQRILRYSWKSDTFDSSLVPILAHLAEYFGTETRDDMLDDRGCQIGHCRKPAIAASGAVANWVRLTAHYTYRRSRE
jgi:hypothetical protein